MKKRLVSILMALGVALLLTACSPIQEAQVALDAGDPETAFTIAQSYLNHEDAEVKVQAIKIVGKTKGERAASALYIFLNDENPRIAAAAASALGDTGHFPAGKHLVEQIQTAKSSVLNGIAEGFVKLGSEAMIPLVSAFEEAQNENERNGYREMLMQIGSPAVPVIISSFNRNSYRKKEKLAILGKSKSPEAVSFLIEQIDNDEVDEMVLEELIRMGSFAADQIVHQLKNIQKENSKAERKIKLCRALGDIKVVSAIPILEQLARDSDRAVSAAAEHALSKTRGF